MTPEDLRLYWELSRPLAVHRAHTARGYWRTVRGIEGIDDAAAIALSIRAFA
jgi:hypothetical protein